MGNIERRLSAVERAVGKGGVCSCFNPLRVYFTPAVLPGQSDVRPSDVCEVCGGVVSIIRVVYVENWRGFIMGHIESRLKQAEKLTGTKQDCSCARFPCPVAYDINRGLTSQEVC